MWDRCRRQDEGGDGRADQETGPRCFLWGRRCISLLLFDKIFCVFGSKVVQSQQKVDETKVALRELGLDEGGLDT